MVKPDKWIKKMVLEHKMIEPFEPSQVKAGAISYGVSSYGYDMRAANEFKIFSPQKHKDLQAIDPKNFDEKVFESVFAENGSFVIIPPNSVALARSVEYFRIPRDIITIGFGKSTYARSGILVNITPFEPEWEGFVTISISNVNSVPVKVYAGEGIAQILFMGVSEVCETSYADKKGKYQAQRDITSSKVD